MLMSYKMAAIANFLIFFVYFSSSFIFTSARIHHITVESDTRPMFTLSTFGFLKHGSLSVNVTNFVIPKESSKVSNTTFGFTLDVSSSTGASGFMEDYTEECILDDTNTNPGNVKDDVLSIIFFRMDLKNNKVLIERRGKALKNIQISQETSEQFWKSSSLARRNTDRSIMSDSYLLSHKARTRRETLKEPLPAAGSADKPEDNGTLTTTGSVESQATSTPVSVMKEPTKGDKPIQHVTSIPMTVTDPAQIYSFFFMVAVTSEEEEGMYNLNFHNCLSMKDNGRDSGVTFTLDLIEENNRNYLSAGKMPLPTLYLVLALVYLGLAVFWNTVLCKSKESVYKMHYLMMTVVFVKALSCLLHMINYHFIRKEGIREEAWAVIFYIAYLTRGALLFITIILIGSGWAFIKHVLSDREKKLFAIVIPLQILDNIAWIIVEESEEAQSQYTVWKEIFILIDLLCCGAILFPVVWSIRHLQEASRADGKAELSLTKLKLFRQFYIMVVCYIYFTRIIVYLLNMTVPFKYQWLDELFREMATITFFMVTGYKFRPAPDNPYLQVPLDSDEEEDIEMDTVIVGESSTVNTLKKVNQSGKTDQPEGPKLRESSHEYD